MQLLHLGEEADKGRARGPARLGRQGGDGVADSRDLRLKPMKIKAPSCEQEGLGKAQHAVQFIDGGEHGILRRAFHAAECAAPSFPAG